METERELLLFYKLYLLHRHMMYINYMKDARTLATWFDFTKHNEVDIKKPVDILCGNCFARHGVTIGGGILISCAKCYGVSNMSYEIDRLAHLTNTPWEFNIYMICKAITEIYERPGVNINIFRFAL